MLIPVSDPENPVGGEKETAFHCSIFHYVYFILTRVIKSVKIQGNYIQALYYSNNNNKQEQLCKGVTKSKKLITSFSFTNHNLLCVGFQTELLVM